MLSSFWKLSKLLVSCFPASGNPKNFWFHAFQLLETFKTFDFILSSFWKPSKLLTSYLPASGNLQNFRRQPLQRAIDNRLYIF